MANEITSKDKWMISFYTIIVFFILINPFTFMLVNKLTMLLGLEIASENGSPNIWGMLLHGFIFFLIIRLMMSFNLPSITH